jgi:hypothetical protein
MSEARPLWPAPRLLAVEVRQRFPKQQLPILLMSASADPRVVLPDVSFMPKPFDTPIC